MPLRRDLTFLPEARAEILLLSCVSYGFFGIYMALFAMTIWSSSMVKHSILQMRLRWLVWVTAILIVFRQVVGTMGTMNLCGWDYSDGGICGKAESKDSFTSISAILTHYVSLLVNIYMPPVLALLCDGALAWRVYVLWNRPRWLLAALPMSLAVNCVLGLWIAVHYTQRLQSQGDLSLGEERPGINAVYPAWVWVSFAQNSLMSFSILTRMWQLASGQFTRKNIGRYATVIRAVIESALLSWTGTLACAINWSIQFSGSNLISSDLTEELNDTLQPMVYYVHVPVESYRSSMFIALPYLLAISQVLLITRVNLSKFRDTDAFASFASQWWAIDGDALESDTLQSVPHQGEVHLSVKHYRQDHSYVLDTSDD